MSSSQNPTPSPPPYSSDQEYCEQGICSKHCQEHCRPIFAPPPPLSVNDDLGTKFSHRMIAVIIVMSISIVLAIYFAIMSRYRRARNMNAINNNMIDGIEIFDDNQIRQEEEQVDVGPRRVNDSNIEWLEVYKYKRSDGLVERTDCMVCLSEFEENEDLRLLPRCPHAFHTRCVDRWLRSQPTCPLCRASALIVTPATT